MHIISFNSTHHAIRFEKILKDSNFDIRTIPTPREISSSCGLSIKFEESKLENIICEIKNSKVDYYGIFKIYKTADEKREAIKLY